jgi:hypothetical protein
MSDFSQPQAPISFRDTLVSVGKELITHSVRELARVPLIQYGQLPQPSYQVRPQPPAPPPQLGVTTGCASCDVALMLAGAERYLDRGLQVLSDPNLVAWYVNHARGFLAALQTRLKTFTAGPLPTIWPEVASVEARLGEMAVPYVAEDIASAVAFLNDLSHRTFALAEGRGTTPLVPPRAQPVVTGSARAVGEFINAEAVGATTLGSGDRSGTYYPSANR